MLFLKECKKILFSLTFLLYVFVVFAMFFTQFYSDCEPILPPEQGQESYGMKIEETPEILMPAAVQNLINEYSNNDYTAYPFGFYKSVHLSEKKQENIAKIIAEITGFSKDEMNKYVGDFEDKFTFDENGEVTPIESDIPEIEIADIKVSYERFKELMTEADELIGSGSDYGEEYLLSNFSRVPKTYEDALAEYTEFYEKDKISGGYARLCCDYLGIFLAVMPVFVAASLCFSDKKARMQQLVYSRKISSAKLVFTRYFALTATMLLPVIIALTLAHFKVFGLYPNENAEIDKLAFFKTGAIWLVPNIMTSTAVGMFVTEIFSPIAAILVQGAWWIFDVFASIGKLSGGIEKFTLVIRHNSVLNRNEFQADYSSFIFNRSFYTIISLVAVALTVIFYEMKRGGKINELGTFIKNRRSKS